MPKAFPKPKFAYSYERQQEIARLRQHKQVRGIPAKQADRLLVATWNIANFGGQERRDQDHRLITEILSWFDIFAIQEVKENFGGLADVHHHLGGTYRLLFSDTAGNNERMAFVYDGAKVTLLEKVGEIAFPVAQLKRVKVPGIGQSFQGFDRTPYLATFQAGRLSFLLVNVHLYYGTGRGKRDRDRRALETLAVALWASDRHKSQFSYARDIIALGDFNMPKRAPDDPIYKALTAKGLHVPVHTSKVGSSIAKDRDYDQIAFFPGETQADFTSNHGVFDFDAVVFPDLWDGGKGKQKFGAYVRYYLSDHRDRCGWSSRRRREA
jgi:endonuclease/exonuclease/phosphatase family metal-dependent hydrolase